VAGGYMRAAPPAEVDSNVSSKARGTALAVPASWPAR
jgi:hypothetical protein